MPSRIHFFLLLLFKFGAFYYSQDVSDNWWNKDGRERYIDHQYDEKGERELSIFDCKTEVVSYFRLLLGLCDPQVSALFVVANFFLTLALAL